MGSLDRPVRSRLLSRVVGTVQLNYDTRYLPDPADWPHLAEIQLLHSSRQPVLYAGADHPLPVERRRHCFGNLPFAVGIRGFILRSHSRNHSGHRRIRLADYSSPSYQRVRVRKPLDPWRSRARFYCKLAGVVGRARCRFCSLQRRYLQLCRGNPRRQYCH